MLRRLQRERDDYYGLQEYLSAITKKLPHISEDLRHLALHLKELIGTGDELSCRMLEEQIPEEYWSGLKPSGGILVGSPVLKFYEITQEPEKRTAIHSADGNFLFGTTEVEVKGQKIKVAIVNAAGPGVEAQALGTLRTEGYVLGETVQEIPAGIRVVSMDVDELYASAFRAFR